MLLFHHSQRNLIPVKMKSYLFLLSSLLLLMACKSNSASEPNTEANPDSLSSAPDTTISGDGHNAQNALDWAGIYKGVVPCADCEGIETVLILNGDNSYLLRTNYLGKPDAQAIEKTGSFTWNAAGNTVILGNIENAPNQYFIGENQVIQLDLSGNRITGGLADKYILIKQ